MSRTTEIIATEQRRFLEATGAGQVKYEQGIRFPWSSGIQCTISLCWVLRSVQAQKRGKKVFVSAASGSVGNLAGQYVELPGCHVVGSAGSQKKVELLKDKLGFHDTFNRKEETDLNSALKRKFPDEINIYFDNVGGSMLEAAMDNMNGSVRVAVCEVISKYIDERKQVALDMFKVVYRRINIRGFSAADFLNLFAAVVSQTSNHLRSGKLQALEDISSGMDSIPSAFIGLLKGDNIGKKIAKVAEE